MPLQPGSAAEGKDIAALMDGAIPRIRWEANQAPALIVSFPYQDTYNISHTLLRFLLLFWNRDLAFMNMPITTGESIHRFTSPPFPSSFSA